jgi:hypothetical protein
MLATPICVNIAGFNEHRTYKVLLGYLDDAPQRLIATRADVAAIEFLPPIWRCYVIDGRVSRRVFGPLVKGHQANKQSDSVRRL